MLPRFSSEATILPRIPERLAYCGAKMQISGYRAPARDFDKPDHLWQDAGGSGGYA